MKVIAVFGSSRSLPGEPEYEAAVALGRLLAEAGLGVTNGGYAGLMEAVSRGAAEAGGTVVGVTVPPMFPDRRGGNAYLTSEITTSSLTERIHVMSETASASIVLGGSIGTMTELMVVWNDAFIATLRGQPPRPIVALRDAWEPTVSALTATLETTSGLVTFVQDEESAGREIVDRFGIPER